MIFHDMSTLCVPAAFAENALASFGFRKQVEDKGEKEIRPAHRT